MLVCLCGRLQKNEYPCCYFQSYEIKSPPCTILWFRILGILPVENIKRLCVFMFQTWENSQLLRRVLWISAELTIVSSLKHKNTQPLYIFNRVRVLHLDRLKEGTWLHNFDSVNERQLLDVFTFFLFLLSVHCTKKRVKLISEVEFELSDISRDWLRFFIW